MLCMGRAASLMGPYCVLNRLTMSKTFAAALLMVCSAATVAPALAEEWPQWRGLRSDGTWRGPQLREDWSEQGLRQVWRAKIGGGYAGVIAVNGRVYTMDMQKEPTQHERVLCFDAATGKLLWSHNYDAQYGDLDYGSGPRSAPTYYDGRIYTLGAVGHIRCLDAETGKLLWSKTPGKEYQMKLPTWGVAASPVIDGDLVIYHPGGTPDGSLMAFDRRTGEERWRSLGEVAGYATPRLVQWQGRKLLVAWTPEFIRGLDPATGRVLWSVPYKVTYGVSMATPVIEEGIVFVCGYWEGSKAIRLGEQPEDAQLLWEDNRNLRGVMSQPLYRDGHVYMIDRHHGLTCFHLETGHKLWDDGNQLTPRSRNPQASLMWLGDSDRMLALNAEGELVLARLSPEGYQELSRAKIIGPTWAHPAMSGNYLYARSDEELVCVELPVKGE